MHDHKTNKGGRPTKMTELVVKKLEEAFLWGCTDVEACQYAGISRTTLTKYQHEHPEFLDKKERFKAEPFLRARKCLVESLENDPHLALKFLERKLREEFSLHRVMTVNDKVRLEGPTPEVLAKMAKAYLQTERAEEELQNYGDISSSSNA